MTEQPLPASPASWRNAAWALASAAAFVASLFASVAIIGGVKPLIGTDHLVDMALWSFAWGALSLAGVVIAGRLLLPEPIRIGPMAVFVGLAGIGLSAVVHVVLQRWEIASFGYVDPDLVGPTAGLFAVLIAVAVAGFSVLAAPRAARVWPLAVTLIGSTLTAAILLGNLPGLADGIRPESMPLAAGMAASGVYVVGVSALSIIRARH